MEEQEEEVMEGKRPGVKLGIVFSNNQHQYPWLQTDAVQGEPNEATDAFIGKVEKLDLAKFINIDAFSDEDKAYPAGTELSVKPKTHHGPHMTETGVTFLAMFTGNVDLTDFKLSAGVE